MTIYLAAVRSYFDFDDVEIVTKKFKRMVEVPKAGREDEQAIDTSIPLLTIFFFTPAWNNP
jgi:hypothetical protein